MSAARLKEIESDFGIAIASAAAKAGAAGMMAKIPASGIYDVTVNAALLYAATMSQSRMTEPEFMSLCRLIWRGAIKDRPAV